MFVSLIVGPISLLDLRNQWRLERKDGSIRSLILRKSLILRLFRPWNGVLLSRFMKAEMSIIRPIVFLPQ